MEEKTKNKQSNYMLNNNKKNDKNWNAKVKTWGQLGKLKVKGEEYWPFVNDKNKFGLACTKEFEVKHWIFKGRGKSNHKPKKQKRATEYTYILKGKAKGWVQDKNTEKKDLIKLEAGDYIIISPKYCSNLVEEIEEYCEGITIKIPSDPDDTIRSC